MAVNGGVIFTIVAIPIVVLLQYGCMLGAPWADTALLTSFSYWSLIVSVSFVWLPYIFLVLGSSLARTPLAACSMVLFIVSLLWQLAALCYWGFAIGLACKNEILCADNLAFDGSLAGVYGGASVRFLFLVVSMGVSLLVHVGACVAAIALHRKLTAVDLSESSEYGSRNARDRLRQQSYRDVEPETDVVSRPYDYARAVKKAEEELTKYR